MTIPARLRELLADDRQAGRVFADVWPAHVEQVLAAVRPASERETWQVVLIDHRALWEAAYDRALRPGRQHLSPELLIAA